MLRGDLHFHSLYSDGELTPIELVKRLKEKNIDIACLTDHDTILGSEEFIKACSKEGIITFPSLELSTYMNEEPIHVLAYFKSLDSIPSKFREHLNDMKIKRYERMKALVDNVNKIYGLGIDLEDHFYYSEKDNDYILSRYACYLIVQNADSRKETVALAKSYIVIQTRKREIIEDMNANDIATRLFIESQVESKIKRENITDERGVKQAYDEAKQTVRGFIENINDSERIK